MTSFETVDGSQSSVIVIYVLVVLAKIIARHLKIGPGKVVQTKIFIVNIQIC